MTPAFDNSYARLGDGFFAAQSPDPVQAPTLITYNTPLAEALGLAQIDDAPAIFAGNAILEGSEPIAQLYAGHQFGHYNPQLGDGRAVLLGEVIDSDGHRRDIQLKGSGRTPFSRGGDGRAWLGPVLREYIVSEAMHVLGVPTTRALAAVRTGEPVWREGAMPGAILTRVASSHIRVGTFQVFAARRDIDRLATLFEYASDRHAGGTRDPHEFLDLVIERQAALVAKWMSFGFIHGVMNTDNCTISGETIDYGPCAFLDAYDPGKVFSSIDQFGRYAYAAQVDIIVWNMAQLATALVPLLPDTDAAVARFTEQVQGMAALLQREWLTRFVAKLGIADPDQSDAELVADLLDLMQAGGSDFTNTFRALLEGGAADQIADRDGFARWEARWRQRGPDQAIMARANPAFIPRNHRIEEMIAAAVAGDDTAFHRLNDALSRPFDPTPDDDWLRAAPSAEQRVTATFCGT